MQSTGAGNNMESGWEPTFGMSLSDAYYDVIEKVTSRSWPEFARRGLRLQNGELDVIRRDFPDDATEQMYRMCKVWEGRNGRSATTRYLYAILNHFLNPDIHPKPVIEEVENNAGSYCARPSQHEAISTKDAHHSRKFLSCYDKLSGKGKVLIINNTFEGLDMFSKRCASDIDEVTMKTLWRDFFANEVIVYRDVTAVEMEKCLVDFSQSCVGYDYCAVVIMSHGGESDFIYGKTFTEDDKISARKVIETFDSFKSPCLKGIPKLFFFQCSRGRKIAESFSSRVLSRPAASTRNGTRERSPSSPEEKCTSCLRKISSYHAAVMGKERPISQLIWNGTGPSILTPPSNMTTSSDGKENQVGDADALEKDLPPDLTKHKDAEKKKLMRTKSLRQFADERSGMPEEYNCEALNLPAASDMLVCYCTAPGYPSFRDPRNGSWFINAVTNVFTEHSAQEHVADLMIKVNEAMSEKYGTVRGKVTAVAKCTSQFECTLRKKLYLQKNPLPDNHQMKQQTYNWMRIAMICCCLFVMHMLDFMFIKQD